MRTLYWTGSFHYIRYKGVRATTKQAPIVCAAPHTSFYDSIVAIILGPSSVVAKSETADMSFFGSKQKQKTFKLCALSNGFDDCLMTHDISRQRPLLMLTSVSFLIVLFWSFCFDFVFL